MQTGLSYWSDCVFSRLDLGIYQPCLTRNSTSTSAGISLSDLAWESHQFGASNLVNEWFKSHLEAPKNASFPMEFLFLAFLEISWGCLIWNRGIIWKMHLNIKYRYVHDDQWPVVELVMSYFQYLWNPAGDLVQAAVLHQHSVNHSELFNSIHIRTY